MKNNSYATPQERGNTPIKISKSEARRFLLAHQHLWPPRSLKGKEQIVNFISHVGCIQFDPVNVVGRNPDLVLQSRVRKYRSHFLEQLVYEDRLLLDGWDKMASIYARHDWPCFARHRAHVQQHYGGPENPSMRVAPFVLESIRNGGAKSSIDLDLQERIDWSWGRSSSLTKAALDSLYAMGKLLIHHRVGTRRVFDLADRLLPADLLAASDPHPTSEAFQEWHFLRRIGGLGIAHLGASEFWGGILEVRTKDQRSAIIQRLYERGALLSLAVEELPQRRFYIRQQDWTMLERILAQGRNNPRAAILAPLDNLLWDRNLLRWLFDFDYVWEVYKPAVKRKYGYYVLPLLYGDRFVARFEPGFNRKSGEFIIKDWWWETDVQLNEALETALVGCLQDFAFYLDASRVKLGDGIKGEPSLRFLSRLEPLLDRGDGERRPRA